MLRFNLSFLIFDFSSLKPIYYFYPRYDYPFLQNGLPVISGLNL